MPVIRNREEMPLVIPPSVAKSQCLGAFDKLVYGRIINKGSYESIRELIGDIERYFSCSFVEAEGAIGFLRMYGILDLVDNSE